MIKKQKVSIVKRVSVGLVFIAASFLPYALPSRMYGFWDSLFFGAAYYVGGMYVADAAIIFLSGTSLMRTIVHNPVNRLSFIKLGLWGALPFSLAVSTFGGLWYFPHWTFVEYITLGFLLLGWPFYFLFLTLFYQAFKLTLDHIIPQVHPVRSYYTFEKKAYKAFGIVGGWLAVMVITVGFQNSRWLTDFHFSVNSPQRPYLYWYWWLIAVAGWILLCEFIEYRRRRSSLFKDIIHGYWTPLIAIFLSGIMLAVTNEFQNLPIDLWHYANFPWANLTVLHIPLFVVIGWPLHIAAFVEFWRAFGEEQATKLLFANAFRSNRRS